MAERSAIASGFSLSDIGTDSGCCLKVATGGGTTRGRGSEGSRVANCATAAVGVMGDTGGRSGERDSERLLSRWCEGEGELLGEVDRVLVSTRSAGMAEVERGRREESLPTIRSLGLGVGVGGENTATRGRGRCRLARRPVVCFRE